MFIMIVMKLFFVFIFDIMVNIADELGEYFSAYGTIVEHQIMLDHKTGRSRGFGFVTFENEDALDKIFSDGKVHELGGKQVQLKKNDLFIFSCTDFG